MEQNDEASKVFQCEFCPLIYYSQSSLNRHRTVSHLPKEFACNLCPKTYANQRTLNYHQDTKHTPSISSSVVDADANPYLGFLGDVSISTQSGLSMNWSQEYTDIQQELKKCPWCHYISGETNDLWGHMLEVHPLSSQSVERNDNQNDGGRWETLAYPDQQLASDADTSSPPKLSSWPWIDPALEAEAPEPSISTAWRPLDSEKTTQAVEDHGNGDTILDTDESEHLTMYEALLSRDDEQALSFAEDLNPTPPADLGFAASM